MNTIKKLISVVLTVTMIVSLMTAAYAEESDNTAYESIPEEMTDLSGEVFSEILGDGRDYQITELILADDNTAATITYLAADEADLIISIKDEMSEEEVYKKETAVSAGQGTITVELDAEEIPQYFWIEAALVHGEAEVSGIFSYVDRTSEYQEFLNATVNDPEYAGNVILDYGENEEGQDNFAVVRDDVKVIRVDQSEDIRTLGSESAELFGLLDENEGYIISDITNTEIIDTIVPGDRVLILPADDVSEAKILTVDTVEETAALFGDEEEDTVAITAAAGDRDLADYFDYVRLDITVDADTDNLDTSSADEDVEFIDEIIVDESEDGEETAALFATKDAKKSVSKSLTAKIISGNVTVKDTVSLSASVKFSIDYKTAFKVPVGLNRISATSSVEAKNVFNISSTRKASYTPPAKKLGTIPLGNINGVNFSIPVYFTFSASFDAKFDFTATQVAGFSLTASYDKKNGFSVNTSKYASSTKSIETEAKVTARVGIKAVLEVSFINILNLSLTGNVGVQATGRVQSINSTSTYRHRDVIACLDVDLSIYLQPELMIKFLNLKLADHKWKETTRRFMAFYIHKKANKGWVVGTGDCPYREYRVKYTVKDGKTGKGVGGVAIKEGGKTLGTTGSTGKADIWLSIRSHTLKLSKNGYNTGTAVISVSKSFSKEFKLYKKGSANDAVVSMSDLYNITDEEWAEFTNEETAERAGNIGNTIIQIQSEQDLEKLAEFTAKPDRSTANIKFQFNNATSTIDMSGSWTPIGTESSPFEGIVDGNKFTVTGLTGSLFGYVENAEIHDLTIEKASVTGTGDTGILTGTAKASRIYDIGIIGGSVEGAKAGGIAGSAADTEIINSFSTAEVKGTQSAGGIAGAFAYTDAAGRMENIYAAGSVSGESAGAVAGSVTYASGSAESSSIYDTGIQNVYYLDSIAEQAFAQGTADAVAAVYPVTEEQAQGNADGTMIAGNSEYADAGTLLEALNNWYTKNGAVSIRTENEENPDAVDGVENNDVPDSSPNDSYNHWFADGLDKDGNYINAGFPAFGEKAAVYRLTVEYVYEDGSEAFPTVEMYYTEGQAYDIDTRSISGYHTYEEEYNGNMPANDLEYRVIYLQDSPYTDTMTNLAGSNESAQEGSSYSISNEAELVLFSKYVNSGKNTKGVTFVQTAPIEMTIHSAYVSAGTSDTPFEGTFEGKNQGIATLGTSLFGYTRQAKINEVLAAVNIDAAENEIIGGIAAAATLYTVISNCTVEAAITGFASAAGGIAGKADYSFIDKCTVRGSIVEGAGNVGGIVGLLSGGAGTVRNSVSEIPVAGVSKDACVGGIAGVVQGDPLGNATVANSYADKVVGSGAYNETAGGIAGRVATAKISNVYFDGIMSGDTDAVIGAGSLYETDSVWFNSKLHSTAKNAGSFSKTAAGVEELLESLNSWLESPGRSSYLTWSLPVAADDAAQTVETPVFGAPFASWIMNMDISNGRFSCDIDISDYTEGTVYIAFYNASGQQKSIVKAASGSNSISVGNNVVSAKAFVMSNDMIPMTKAVTYK